MGDCWHHPAMAMSAVPIEHGDSPAPAADCSDRHVRTAADNSFMLGQDEAMKRWHQRRAKKREKRLQRWRYDCGDLSAGGEQTDAEHGCANFWVSLISSTSARSTTDSGYSLYASSSHAPLTDRGILCEDAVLAMFLGLQLPDDSRINEANAYSIAPAIGVTEVACDTSIRRVWNLES